MCVYQRRASRAHYDFECSVISVHLSKICWTERSSFAFAVGQCKNVPGRRAPEVTTYLTNNPMGFCERLVMQQFTNRWRGGYLLNLPEQSVCNSKGRNDCISVGDIVIVKDDKTNCNFWKLHMVESLLWGGDDIVRLAVVKVVDGKGNQLQRLRRPIQHLISIEV